MSPVKNAKWLLLFTRWKSNCTPNSGLSLGTIRMPQIFVYSTRIAFVCVDLAKSPKIYPKVVWSWHQHAVRVQIMRNDKFGPHCLYTLIHMQTLTYIDMNICVCIYTFIQIHLFKYTYDNVCLYEYEYVCACMCIYTHISIHTHAHTHVYLHTYQHTHSHTHAWRTPSHILTEHYLTGFLMFFVISCLCSTSCQATIHTHLHIQ